MITDQPTAAPTRDSSAVQAHAIVVGRIPGPDGTASFALLARWPQDGEVPAEMAAIAREAIDSDTPITRRLAANGTRSLTASPVRLGSPPRPCALAMIHDGPAAGSAGPVPSHRTGAGSQDGDTRQPDARRPSDDDPLDERQRPASMLRLLAAVNAHDHVESASLALVGEIAALTGARRVSIGYVSGDTVQVAAMSNTARVRGRSPLVRELAQAMDESIDQAATIVYPAGGGREPRISLAHGRYAARSHCPLLCTVPMLVANDDGRALIGAITLEFADNRHLDICAVRFAESVGSALGPTLDARRRLATPIAGRLASSLAGRPRHLLREGGRGRRIALALAGALLAAAALVPVPYRVTAEARVEGATQQVLAAPVAGYVGTVYVRPGERVLAGQPVVDLDDRELRLEQRRWTAEIAQIEKHYGDALAREDQTEIAVQRARMEQARAQLGIVEKQLERVRLRAPFDGLIISGDLWQSLGAPVRRGETLITIAPNDEYRIMVAVDERHIATIHEGQTAQVLLPALPGAPLAITLGEQIPVSTPRGGRNVFEVRAQPQALIAGLRPGMSGIAKIEAGSRPVLASLTADLRAWLRMQLWRLGL